MSFYSLHSLAGVNIGAIVKSDLYEKKSDFNSLYNSVKGAIISANNVICLSIGGSRIVYYFSAKVGCRETPFISTFAI